MKLNGKKLSESNKETIVFPRPDGDLVFVLAAVLCTDEFEKLCPEVLPPMIRRPSQDVATPDLSDKDYQNALMERAKQQSRWMFLKSISATPGLEWEEVDINKPNTWDKIDEEFLKSGIVNSERVQLYNAMMRANSLDAAYLKAARERFFASQQAPKS